MEFYSKAEAGRHMCRVLYFYLCVASHLLISLRIFRIKVKLVFVCFFKLQVDCPLIFYSALDNTSYTQTMLPNSPITSPLGLSNLIPIALQIDTPVSQPIATWNNSANTISPSLGEKKKEKCIDFSVNVNFFFDYKCGINYHPPLAND